MWQPIETVPKDGRFVILGGPSGYHSTPTRVEIARWHQAETVSYWQCHDGEWFTAGGDDPTCWMPLPDNNEQYTNCFDKCCHRTRQSGWPCPRGWSCPYDHKES